MSNDTLKMLATVEHLTVTPGPDHDRIVQEAVDKPIPGIPPIKMVRACDKCKTEPRP